MRKAKLFETKKTDTELFVYYAGVLIYKKWLKTDQPSKLFNQQWPNVDVV